MKNKLILTTIFSCLALGNMQAQTSKNKPNVRIEWGEDIPLPKKHYPFGFVGNYRDGYAQIAVKGKKEISLVKIDNKLRAGETEITTYPKSKYIVLDNILEVNGKAYLMFSDYDKAANSEKLLMQEIDVKRGTFKGSPEVIIQTDTKVMGNYEGSSIYTLSTTNKFKIILPDTGNRLLIYYRRKPEIKSDKKNYDKLVYTVFDFDMKEQWSKEVTMPYTESEMKIREHSIIDNDVFLFAETKSGETFEKNKKTPAFDQLSVFKITKESSKPKEKELIIDQNSYIREFIIGEGFGESMLISGYYRPSKKSFVYTGYYTAVFNPATMELERVQKYEFKEDLVSSFETARTKRKLDKDLEKGKDIGIPYMIMREVLKRPDGGWYVVGEQHHVVLLIDNSGRTTKHTWKFYYQDIIVSSINAFGEEEWIKKLPKNQLSQYSTYSSFGILAIRPTEYFITSNFGSGTSAFVHNNDLYVFYLDNIKNKNLKESDVQAPYMNFKGSYLAGVKLETDGEKTQNVIYDLKDEDNKLVSPTTLVPMGDGLLLSASRRGMSIFAKKSNVPALIYME